MPITIEALVANGFEPTTYDGQPGTFYVKKLKASQMPYFNEHVVDNELVFDTDEIVVEVFDGEENGAPLLVVQLVDQNTDYFEEAVPVESKEGLALLKDAGFISTN